MTRYAQCLLICLLAGLICCLPPAHAAEQRAPLRVVMDNNYPPYAFLDSSGALQGILVDQWRLWEQKSGTRVELQGLDWSEALRRMRNGEFDVIDTIFKTESRLAAYDFTPPYQQLEVPIFFDREIAGIRDIASLKGFPVAVKAGDAAIDLLRNNGVDHLIEYPSYEALIKAAGEHKVNVFVADQPPALYFLHKYGLTETFRSTAPLYVGEFHRAVKKGNSELLRQVEEGFAAVTADEYRSIEKKWRGSRIVDSSTVKQLGWIAGGALVLLVMLVVWNRMLRGSVIRRTAELAASEERYRSLVDNIPLGVSLIDRDHRIIMVNRAQAELFNRPAGWFPGRLCYEEFEKRASSCAHCPGVVSMATGGVAFADAEGVRDDGSRLAVQIRTVPLYGPDGASSGFIEVVEDVTERRQAQSLLENERSRLRTLLKTIPDLVWLKDPEGTYLACNPRFERFFGASEADIVGRSDYDFVDRELADFFREHDRKAIAAGGPSINEEWVSFADDGHRELLETIKTPMRDSEGRLVGVLGVARDITALRQAEESLRQSQARLNRAQQISRIGCWELNLQTGVLFWSDEIFAIFEIDKTKFAASYEAFLAAIHPADRAQVDEAYQAALAGRTPYSIDHRLLFPDGRIKWVHEECETSYDLSGKAIMSLGTVQDITERKMSAEKIREQAELLELARDGIFVRDLEDRIIFWNRGAEERYGWKRSEVTGRMVHDLLKTEFPLPLDEVRAKLLKRGIWQGELVHTTRDGTRIIVASRWYLKRDDAGQALAIMEINTDITERKRLEDELLRSQRLESLGVLAGGIAHDFNNILTGILGNISFARRLIGEEHKATRRLQECERASRRAAELTQQLLTFARGGEPLRKPVNTRQLIEESISFALHGANVSGVLHCPPDVWWLDADEGQLTQVFNNLLINAKQAMPDGGSVTLHAENIRVDAHDPARVKPGRYVRITLADQGCGIPEEHLEKIFDPYFTTKQQGSGLGLASVYSIVKRHGGSVSASSQPGAGSVFVLLLPAAASADTAAQQGMPQAEQPVPGSGRILVMDDEELIRELAVVMLDELGYRAEACSDGERAVAMYAAAREAGEPYAAVILDLTVPGGMGGREAAEQIHALDPHAPLIVSSGYSSDALLSECRAHGFAGIVRKPYTLDEVAAELARVISSHP